MAKDIRARHVNLHSRGKTESGTLYLTQHHLIFSYIPNTTNKQGADGASIAASRGVSGVQTPKFSTDTSNSSITSTAEESRSNEQPHGSDSTQQPTSNSDAQKSAQSETLKKEERSVSSRPKPKEIWVPYPMINSCLLRPSSTSVQTLRPHDPEARTSARDSTDDAFPPVYGTSNFARPSTDSASFPPYASPKRAVSPAPGAAPTELVTDGGRSQVIRIRRRDFQMMAFHFQASASEKNADESAREVFFALRSRCCAENVSDMHAFHFKAPEEERIIDWIPFDARREFARMGISAKAAEGVGSAWRVSDINSDYQFSATYPNVLCVPRTVSDNMLKYGGPFRSKSRIPALTYLHHNGGSIARSSQPMVGVQGKRNPQDEKLVSAIFSSHTPRHSPEDSPSASTTVLNIDAADIAAAEPDGAPMDPATQNELTVDEQLLQDANSPRRKIYGSTRQSIIADARPKMNMFANRALGGGIEDTANYTGANGKPIDKVFLNIANIHVMRSSLEKIVESFANSDYLDMKPNQELLRKSGWLEHIAGLLDGADMIAKAVGLGGSHVLVHCSDGWDRTSQVAALAEIMLDPYYRSFNGFMTLVQKDFLSFGHKFKHRHGILGCEKWFEIENERVMPSRAKNTNESDNNTINNLSSKAFSGAKSWLEKNRNTIFRQQNGRSSLDGTGSRSSSPPPNAVLHSTPTPETKQERDHRVDEKEIAPIFHQFLDAVYQLLHQNPTAFEYNERFLRRLFYQAYSGQYGEFLFNNEKERSKYRGEFPSVWPHFLSRKHEFINPEYSAKMNDSLLLPQRHTYDRQIIVHWWSGLFGRKVEEMNTARSLAPPDAEATAPPPHLLNPHHSEVALTPAQESLGETDAEAVIGGSGGVKEARSVPNFGTLREILPVSTPAERTTSRQDRKTQLEIVEPSISSQRVTEGVEPDLSHGTSHAAVQGNVNTSEATIEIAEEGDPLGVSVGQVKDRTSALDFAAFARQSAFSDR